MNMYLEDIVAMVLGMTVGFTGPLVAGWLKALVTRAAAAKQQEPAQAKAKRSYKRKVTSGGTAVRYSVPYHEN